MPARESRVRDAHPLLSLSTNPEEFASLMEADHPDGIMLSHEELVDWFATAIETAKLVAVASLPLPPLGWRSE